MKFIFKSKSEERIGEINILLSALIFAGFPVVLKLGGAIPPIFYASVSTLITALMMLVILGWGKGFKELKNRQAWPLMLLVTLFIIILPYLLIYRGVQMTTGINASILFQSEVFFALLFGWIIGESITSKKLGGAFLIITGTVLVVFNGTFQLNLGDLMIIFATAFYPVGNIFAKKALKMVSPNTLVFVRSLIGGLVLLLFSIFLEDNVKDISMTQNLLITFWWLFLLNGILVSGITKILWYRGLKRLDVSKSTILVMTYPAFGVIYASTFLKEIPTAYQLLGLVIVILGVYTVTRSNKTISAKLG